jgi:hypothetical protein
MMHLMQPRHERPMRMTQHAMNHVLKQRPREDSSRKDKRIGEHDDDRKAIAQSSQCSAQIAAATRRRAGR